MPGAAAETALLNVPAGGMGTLLHVQSVTAQSGGGRWSLGSGVVMAASHVSEPLPHCCGHTHSRPCSHVFAGYVRRHGPQPSYCLRRVGTYAGLPSLSNCQP